MTLQLFEWDLKNKGEANQMSLNQILILLNLQKQYDQKKKMSLNKPCQYNQGPSQQLGNSKKIRFKKQKKNKVVLLVNYFLRTSSSAWTINPRKNSNLPHSLNPNLS